jgi:NADPH:quinone reductase-like Zn-dependent oxidoreductase
LVSVVSPPSGQPLREDIRYVYFIVAPSGAQLREIGALMDAGQIHPVVDQVFPLAQARQAYETAASGHPRGKTVIRVG